MNAWKREWTMPEIRRFYAGFGPSISDWLADLLATENAAIKCDTWARGAWDCNEPEAYSRMTSLAAHIRSGLAFT